MSNEIIRYHKGAIFLHWLVGLALIANLALGLLLDEIEGAARLDAFNWHKSLGMTVLALSVLRLFWRLTHKVPAELPSFKPWEKIIAKITHALFYVLMIGIPLSGWAMVSASPKNIPTVFFGLFTVPQLSFLQGFENQKEIAGSFKDMHEVMANGILILLGLHIAAAVWHHFILKDHVLLRMTPKWLEPVLKGKK